MKRYSAAGISAVCLIGISMLFVPASVEGQGALPSIAAGGVVSASAFGQFKAIAPGTWIEIYGSNLASTTRSWTSADFSGVNAPTSLTGTSVSIGNQAAFIDFISPTQVNAQVPSGVGTGTQSIVVMTATGSSAPYSITVNQAEPGLLAPASFNIGGNQNVVALFPDNVTYVAPPGSIPGVTSKRAQPGDVITLYGVGFGQVAPIIPAGQIVQESNSLASPFQLFFAQTAATLSYDGLAPDAVGLYQFNVTVPNIAGGDATPLTFSLGGISGTQTLYIAVQGSGAPEVQSLTLSSTSVAGGGTVQSTVVLSGPAPTGGAAVALTSSANSASVPATVTVPAGSSSASFSISTSSVSAAQSATITASYGGSSAQAVLMITPSSTLSFSMVGFTATFQPTGYGSFGVNFSVSPENGLSTFAVTSTTNGSFAHCTASNGNLTFTCTMLSTTTELFSSPFATIDPISSASLSFTLSPQTTLAGIETGSVSGTLSVSGKLIATSTTTTLSGPITGNFTLYPVGDARAADSASSRK